MGSITRSAGLAVGLLLAGTAPGLTASPATEAFLANVTPNVDFLDRSSRFALENSKNARVRAFALGQAREQTLAANALYDWTQAGANPMIASVDALDRTPTGSTPPSADPAPPARQPVADPRLPRGQEDLDSLEGLEGPAFDAEYKDKQRDALEQIETDYETYLAKGDDPALLKIAKSELPKVKARLAALGKL